MKTISCDSRVITLTCILLLVSVCQYAQVSAPTLSAGLTAVTGQRGNLDIELLSEIVSEKQEEVKREILQRKILNNMQGQSFAMQNFVYSCFHALLSYKDKKAIERELLTQVSILSLQAGLAEAILHLSFRKSTPSPQLEGSIKHYMMQNFGVTDAEAAMYFKTLMANLKHEPFMLLFSFDQELEKIVKEEKKHKKHTFTAILLDAIFESSRTSSALQTMGFVQLNPNLQPFYAEMNQYIVGGSQGYADLRVLVDVSLELLVKYHAIFYDFVNDDALTIRKLFERRELRFATLTDDDLESKIQEAEGYIDFVRSGMNELLLARSVDHETVDRLSKMLDLVRDGFTDFKARKGSNASRFSLNDYYFVRQHVQPLINDLISLGILGTSQVQTIDQLTQVMYDQFLKEVHEQITDPSSPINALDTIEIREYGHLISIITSLSRLDDVKSYEQIFNTLAQIGISSLGNSQARFLKDIVYYLEAFTSINREENLLTIEVESLLLKILALYENRASGDAQLYFGVGLNQTLDVDYASPEMALMGPDSMTLNSLSFASEKIGLKFKLINNKRIQSKQEQELNWFLPKLVHQNNMHRSQQPVISDLYVFGYGSGLLYNVANLTTAGSNFDYAMVGVGIGIAFFNALDLNIWRVSPIVNGQSFGDNWSNRSFVGFSFDIKLTEYLTALSEKKAQRKIAETK